MKAEYDAQIASMPKEYKAPPHPRRQAGNAESIIASCRAGWRLLEAG